MADRSLREPIYTNSNNNNNNTNYGTNSPTATNTNTTNTNTNTTNKVMEEVDEERKEEEEALKELDNTINSFRWYFFYVQQRLEKSSASFAALPQHHRVLVPDFDQNIQQIKVAAKKNYELLLRVLPPQTTDKPNKPNTVNDSDMDKVKTSLQQIVRDWSEECATERDICYSIILSALNAKFPDSKARGALQILVPGAGLCRLAFDIAKQGFRCQANEFSFSMLLIANFILNKNHGVKTHKIYPWLLNFSNNLHTNDQLEEYPNTSLHFNEALGKTTRKSDSGVLVCRPTDRPIIYHIPDVDTSLRDGNLSMCAGDFLEIYTEHELYDGIVTCFFLDTARNVIQYIEHIFNLLKPNGMWVNIGPLLYHYSENPSEASLDLSYEQLKNVIKGVGFIIETEHYPVTVPYVENKSSMLHTSFDCVFFTAIKPAQTQTEPVPPPTIPHPSPEQNPT